MRIAYVANYQGLSLVERRPCMHNLSLAARTKIQTIVELLRSRSHEVEIISQGQVEPSVGRDRFRVRYFPGFEELPSFDPAVPVRYASALSMRFVTGFWESVQTRRLLDARHDARKFDLVLIYNLQRAQIGCALHASNNLGLPVVLQYEDDAFVDVHGQASRSLTAGYHRRACRSVLRLVSGGTGVSPYLLDQMPPDVPKVLLRGTVSEDIRRLTLDAGRPRKNWVVFSGTHEWTQGLEQLVAAWRSLDLKDWELHVAGHGPLTSKLQSLAAGDERIVFHGLLNRAENAQLLCQARIGINPQDLTKVPGSVFAFKIVEYLAAGLHVISTPRGAVEPELEAGITYVQDNAPELLAACLRSVIESGDHARTAQEAALASYGPDAVAESFDRLIRQASRKRREQAA